MRYRLMLLLLFPAGASSQAFVRVSAGVTASTDFVKDFLVEPLAARQSIAPTGAALVGWRFANDIRFGVEDRLAMGSYEIVEEDFTDDLGSLTTLGLSLFVDGPITGALRWEAVAGMLRYQPEREIGVFGSGAPSPWMAGGGVSWTRPLNTSLHVVLSARYDYHGFNTKRLDTDGYASRQSVHRAGLMLAVERGF